MSPQQQAARELYILQRNRMLAPSERLRPHNDNVSEDEYERGLAVIRAVLERKS